MLGGLSIAVPGEISGQYQAWKQYGWLPWERLVQPAIDLARNGFKVSAAVDDALTDEMVATIKKDKGLRLENFIFIKAGLHWRRSRSRSRSRKSASDQVKIENRSRKRSHKLDRIGVGRIRTVPFSSDSAYDSDSYDPVKTRLSESQAEVLDSFFGFHLRLRQPSFNWIISIKAISGIGRKWNRSDSAYDSDLRFSLGRKRLRLRGRQ